MDRLEQTVQSLANSLDRLVQTNDFPRGRGNTQTEGPNEVSNSHYNERLHIGPSNSFSFLKEASANIDAIPQPPGDATRQSAYSELQYLSSRFNTAEVETQTLKSSTEFHIPSKAAGYRLIGRKLPLVRKLVLELTFQPLS